MSCGQLQTMARLALIWLEIIVTGDRHKFDVMARVMKCNDDIITYQLFLF